MGLKKKASVLLDAIRRHRRDGRGTGSSHDLQLKLSQGTTLKGNAPKSELRSLRSGATRAGAIAGSDEGRSMGHDQVQTYTGHERRDRAGYSKRSMETVPKIHLVEDEEEVMDEEEPSDEYDEDEDEVDDSVAEDMRKLEENFKGISQKYRLINRIGEGPSVTSKPSSLS